MRWVLSFCFALLIVAAIRIVARRPGQKISIYEVEHWVHSLAKIKKEGGTLTISDSNSPMFLRLHRGAGTGRSCKILIDVPRARWSEGKLEVLRDRLEQRGIRSEEPATQPGVLLRVTLEIPDIWDESSGASGARVGREVFEALGVAVTARFNVKVRGENSARTWKSTAERWREEGNPLLRYVGRKIGQVVKHEVESERSDSGTVGPQ
jgi:hypothetical protein